MALMGHVRIKWLMPAEGAHMNIKAFEFALPGFSWRFCDTGSHVHPLPLLQVRYLQGQNARMQEKLTQAERSACATLAQKVCPALGID